MEKATSTSPHSLGRLTRAQAHGMISGETEVLVVEGALLSEMGSSPLEPRVAS